MNDDPEPVRKAHALLKRLREIQEPTEENLRQIALLEQLVRDYNRRQALKRSVGMN